MTMSFYTFLLGYGMGTVLVCLNLPPEKEVINMGLVALGLGFLGALYHNLAPKKLTDWEIMQKAFSKRRK